MGWKKQRSLKKGSFIFGSLALSVSLLVPGSANASSTPYYGKDYSQPKQVLEHYPNPEISYDTPAFNGDRKRFTTQKEMMSYIRELSEGNDLVEMKTIGQSTEGREIPLLYFSKGKNKNQKPTVWIDGSTHSNEPAGGETALVMAHKLAGEFGENILNNINVALVPRVNPDGAYYFTRQTAKDLDPNRDHFKLEIPEIRSLHKAFNQYQPEVAITGHEYGVKYNSEAFQQVGKQGALAYHDILLNSGRNKEIPNVIREKLHSLYKTNAQRKLRSQGYSTMFYHTTPGRNDEGQLIVSEATYGADRGPSNYGLQPSISFITETRGIGIGRESFKRRVNSSVLAQTNILQTTANNAEMVKEDIDNARKKTVSKGMQIKDNDKVTIDQEKKKIPNQDYQVTDIATGETINQKAEFLSTTNVISTLERVRPTKYVLSPEYEKVAKKIKTNGIKVAKTRKPIKLDVESYTVTDKKVDDTKFEGTYQSHVKTEVTSKEMELPEGSFVFSMAQPTANKLPLMLEAESPSSYVTWNEIPSKVGDELPIYRIMEQNALSTEDIELQVDGFVTKESISDSASHSLQNHLSAVGHYEKKEEGDKVVKHMKGFKTLLDHQKDNDLISENAYNHLKTNANYLLNIWK